MDTTYFARGDVIGTRWGVYAKTGETETYLSGHADMLEALAEVDRLTNA